MRVKLKIDAIDSDYPCWLAHKMHVWLKIVAIGTIHGCFRQNSCNWPILYTFQLKELQLAQTMRISVEIVVISSDYVHFR